MFNPNIPSIEHPDESVVNPYAPAIENDLHVPTLGSSASSVKPRIQVSPIETPVGKIEEPVLPTPSV